MIGVLGDIVPLGLGIAFNPIAAVLGILVLGQPDSRRNGLAFTSGWLAGLTLLLLLSTRLAQLGAHLRRGDDTDLRDLIWIGVGVIFLIAAARSLRHRPLPGESPAPGRWMGVIAGGGVWRLLGIGAFLAIVSLRNLALVAAAASAIGEAELAPVELPLTVAAFVAIASLGILVPLLVDLFGGDGADARLARWGDWLRQHMALITGCVLLLLGLYLLGKGIQGLR